MISALAALVLVAQPLQWIDDDLPAALKAAEESRPVLVYVTADWCSSCHQLKREVLSGDAPPAMARAVLARIDFETGAGREVTERYRVLSLPTMLVLSPAGQEIDRVEGYESRLDWLQKLDEAMAGKDSIEAMERQLAEAPGDRDLAVTLAQARLVRGQEDAAREVLLRETRAGGTPGARAGRIWGRYLVRVKRDGVRGAGHFETLAERYRGRPEADEFRYWEAVGHHVAGSPQAALAVFDRWIGADPRSEAAGLSKASFMVHFRYDPAEAENAVRAVLALDEELAPAHYLLAELKLRAGDRVGAIDEIRRAMDLAPKKALYRAFAQQRLGMSDAGP